MAAPRTWSFGPPWVYATTAIREIARGVGSEIRGRVAVENLTTVVWRSVSQLFRPAAFAELAQTLLQLTPQQRRRVGVECHEVPERLATIARQERQRTRVRIRMARDVFANGAIRVPGQAAERFRRDLGVLADQPQEVEIRPGRLFCKFFELIRTRLRAQHHAHFLVPQGVD